MAKDDVSEDIRELASRRWIFFTLNNNKNLIKLYK